MNAKKIAPQKAPKAAPQRIEYCVLCGAATAYTADTPVDQREHYVIGAGQLCPDCARKLEKESYGTCVENC